MARATPGVGVFDVVVRPRAALVRSTALSFVFSAVPLAVALVWVSFPMRLWTVVATVVVLIAIVAGIVFVRFRTAFVGIDRDTVELHGVISPTRRVQRGAIDRLVVTPTFGASPERTMRELIALDATGHHLFRMRGVVWDDRGLDAVVEALGVQVTEADRAVPMREFVRRYPASRAWYERPRAYVWVAAGMAAVLLGVLAIETVVLTTR